jgi:hypothetical protein
VTHEKAGFAVEVAPAITAESNPATRQGANPASTEHQTGSKRKSRWKTQEVARLLELYKAGGIRTVEIAKMFEVCPATVTFQVKKAGLPLRQRGRKVASTPSARVGLMLMLASNDSAANVARRLGISKQAVVHAKKRWPGWVAPDRLARKLDCGIGSSNIALTLWTQNH